MALNFLKIIVSEAETGPGKSKYVPLLDAKYQMIKGVASDAGALVGQWPELSDTDIVWFLLTSNM